MRKLVHLSDIHFGRIDEATVRPLIETIHSLRPDLVAISGDLTQRARTSEFLAARAFLDALPAPRIVVPGNHDIPLHNVYDRFVRGLEKFKLYITDNLEPLYVDSEIVVAGMNSARSAVWKGGRLNRGQVARANHTICKAGRNLVRIIVTHHPFELPDGSTGGALVGRARTAMNSLAACGADLFLAGHLHLGYTAQTAARYRIQGHSALVIQAGTATSTRGRGEANSFNVVHIDSPEVNVEKMVWNAISGAWESSRTERFQKTGGTWHSLPGSTPL